MTLRKLDELDRQIIAALEKDGRRAYRDIGRDLDVPAATVRSRVTRLLESGHIRIAAVGNLFGLGVEVVAITLLRVKPGHVDETAGVLAGYANVRFVGTSFGSADIVIQTLHASLQDLHRFITKELPKAAPAVTGTETFQLAEVVKSSWAWSEWFELQNQLERDPPEEAAVRG